MTFRVPIHKIRAMVHVIASYGAYLPYIACVIDIHDTLHGVVRSTPLSYAPRYAFRLH
jgi:hypothetical protein